jgi:ubiquinone biosynthesis O-methyltransferase
MKKIAVETKLDFLLGEVVLDAGCGSGVVTAHMASKGVSAVGVDLVEDCVKFAARQFGNTSTCYLVASLDAMPFETDTFDKVVCMEVVEHLEHLEPVIQELHRILKPGGLLFITCPNKHSLWPLIEKSVDMLRMGPKMAGAQHVRDFTPKSFEEAPFLPLFEAVEVGTFNRLPSFIAPLSWIVAEGIAQYEFGRRITFGNQIYAILQVRK